ncbi:MAG: potassium channel protein [Methanocorpusculum sp.]|uniref:Potassium channel protein n=1 Tax=Methanocorpusculum petauri TaxID=3002863 RepID=A0ABT4IH30_9EURY|nr:TrkA C-terminal domain-containing protein [Methanocorpusculum petauri]MDE2443620.1 potassium channel protein [Methanocorpusculum sp.]MCZ0861052.1 potassium channel protein [Methanocorpusculum petauri]MDE2519147.1 potassium channel protein [Methanocorpusculum sp.]MDE2522103.1 potassium channel protein [Methanocorpusculum sp.]MDE2524298.1 potassium channel protein [Methanocorpusculum sp.]
MMDRDYQPINLKDVLIEMKDISELMVDLAYSAVLFESNAIADEVIELEERMNDLVYQARITSMMSVRRLEDTEPMSGLLQLAEASERISNQAADIAKNIMRHVSFPANLRKALPEAEEATHRTVVSSSSALDGARLGDIKLQSATGIRIIMIRRMRQRIYDPDKHTVLRAGDVLVGRGPEYGFPALCELAGQPVPRDDDGPVTAISDLDRAAALMIEMKNISELSVGLAYTALLHENMDLANEVVALEEELDEMRLRLDLWTLEAAKRTEDVASLRGMLYMSSFAESISDAASSIADVILREIDVPPILKRIVRESDEIISWVTVRPGSPLDKKSLTDSQVGTVTGMVIFAIKHDNRWTYRPARSVVLHAGDLLVARGRRDGEEKLYGLCGADTDEIEDFEDSE